jgi:endonuclease YncB( thermonuclease family)
MEIFALIAVCAVVWWIASQMGHKTPPKHTTARPRPSTLPKQVRPTRKTAAPSATASRPPPKSSTPEVGEKLEGPAYIIDGDSLRIQKTEIRLFGVDAHEINHPYGQKAKWKLLELCQGQRITAEITAIDHFGRAVAKCYLPDGTDVSAEMVRQGHAIDWPRHSGGVYTHLERPGVRKRLWLANARQNGQMFLWQRYEERKAAAKQKREQ